MHHNQRVGSRMEPTIVTDDCTWLSEIASINAPAEAYQDLVCKSSRALALRTITMLRHPSASRITPDRREDLQNLLCTVGISESSPDPGFFLLVYQCIEALHTPAKFLHAIEKTIAYVSDMHTTPLHKKIGLSNVLLLKNLDSKWIWAGSEMSPFLNFAISLYNEDVPAEAYAIRGIPKMEPPPSLIRGAQVLKENCPVLWSGIQKIVSVICPIQNPNVVGFSISSMPGVIFLNIKADNDEIWYAEQFVHEAAHTKLCLINECTPLISEQTSAVYTSPWRDDKRPLEGILHGMYVHWHVVTMLNKLINTVEDCEKLEQIKQRRKIERANIKQAIQILNCSRALAPQGHMIVEQVEMQL